MFNPAGYDKAMPLLTLGDLQALYDEIRGYQRYRGCLSGLSPSGERPSQWHGQGMEAIDSRPYQPGDDVRHMDWRATARSGKPHSRVFQDERQRSLFLIIDLRAPMYFASKGELKTRRALRCAAMLSLSTLARREAVAGLVVTDDAVLLHPPTKRLADIADLILGNHDRAESLPATSGLLHGSMDRLPAILPRGASLVILSDLNETLDREQEALAPLQALAHRNSCHVIHIQDDAEVDLPALGRLRLTGNIGPIEIDTHDATLRQRYRERIRQHVEAIDAICNNAGIQRIPLDTTDPIIDTVASLLA